MFTNQKHCFMHFSIFPLVLNSTLVFMFYLINYIIKLFRRRLNDVLLFTSQLMLMTSPLTIISKKKKITSFTLTLHIQLTESYYWLCRWSIFYCHYFPETVSSLRICDATLLILLLLPVSSVQSLSWVWLFATPWSQHSRSPSPTSEV